MSTNGKPNKEELARLLFAAYCKFDGAADDCIPEWDEATEYAQQAALAEAEAVLEYLSGISQGLAQQILATLEQHEQEITGIDPFSLNYVHKVANMRSAIKELCQNSAQVEVENA